MRTVHPRQAAPRDLRRRIERLEGIPLRPATARYVIGEFSEGTDDPDYDPAETTSGRSVVELDPGWTLARTRTEGRGHALDLIAKSHWWPSTSREGAEALSRLWRHAVAASLAARRLAREANDPDTDRVARAALLHGLGLWAAGAVDPEWLARLLSSTDPIERRGLEIRDLGTTAVALGRELAERWGCDPLVADSAWLHAGSDRGLEVAANDPEPLVLVQRAFQLAEETPWTLWAPDSGEHGRHDPRVKLLTAEVQSRCGGPLIDTDATPREERLTRSNARLHLRVFELRTGQASRDRLLSALARSDPTDSPEVWAESAGQALCGEPGVTSARVVWGEPETRVPGHSTGDKSDPPRGCPPGRSPTREILLTARGRPFAAVQLGSGVDTVPGPLNCSTLLPVWQAWGALVLDRTRLSERLSQVHDAYHRLVESEAQRLLEAKLGALAEFAAGAGHEMNNPLAVIVGRAQLLMLRETDPKVVRSLRAILSQAQRAHRILRDLMYVARPAEPRPRFCLPDDIVRASLRDARPDAEEREIRLTAESLDHGLRVWADPDGLRHLADMLIRNALESTPRGGKVWVSTGGDVKGLRWTVHDSGRGITPAEGGHLFDPFYCGRQAGRGLGMGLPRASRFVAQTGGDIRWHSTPGRGSTFTVRLPLAEPPQPIKSPAEQPPALPPAMGEGRTTSA